MSRWLPDEELAIAQIREKLQKEIAEQPPYPEVVGDRRLIRFYLGNERKIPKAIEAYKKFLAWRKELNVDRVRQDILYGNAKSPMKFPNAVKIIKVLPQVVFTANALDKRDQPLVVESFNFTPKEFMDNITIKEYLNFLVYSLEFRAMALEQMSDIREKQYLKSHPDPAIRKQRYGVIVYLCNIRDLQGVTLAHFGQQGREILATALKLGLPNYPDYLGVAYFLNAPWIFSTIWRFVKTFLDEDMLSKITILSPENSKVLEEGITKENTPKIIGGDFDLYNETFQFDISPEGPLWYPGAPTSNESTNNDNSNNHSIPTTNDTICNHMPAGQSIASAFASVSMNETNNIKKLSSKVQVFDSTSMTWMEYCRHHVISILFIVIVLIYTFIFHSDRLLWLGVPACVTIAFSLGL